MDNKNFTTILTRNENWAPVMLEALPVACSLWDESLSVLYCNNAALRYHGLSSMNEYMERFNELSPELQPCGRPSVELAREYMREAFDQGFRRFEWVHRTVDGEELPSEVTLSCMEHDGVKILAAYALDLRDIRKTEDRAREADKRAQIILYALPLACNLRDIQGNIVDCNEAALRMFGFKDKSEYFRRHQELLPEYQPCGKTSGEMLREKIRESQEKGQCQFEWIYRDLNGMEIPTEVTLACVSQNGQAFIAGYVRDLREMRKLETSLKKTAIIREATNWIADFLISTHSGYFGERLQASMQMACEATGTAKAGIYKNYLNEEGKLCFRRIYTWAAEGIGSCPHSEFCESGVTYESMFPEWVDAFHRGMHVTMNAQDMDHDMQPVGFWCGRISLLAIPIMVKDELWGFIRFVDYNEFHEYSPGEIEVIRTCANIFASAIIQDETQRELSERSRLSAAINEIAEILASARHGEFSSRLKKAAKLLCGILDFDRAGIFKIDVSGAGDVSLHMTHGFVDCLNLPPERSYPPDNQDCAAPPGWRESVLQGALYTHSMQDAADAGFCSIAPFQLQSCLSIPVLLDEGLWGAVRFDSFMKNRKLSEFEIETAKSCVHLIVSAIIDNESKITMEANNRQLQASRERAEELGRVKTRFLANMSHEIRTPMNAIVGISEILMDEELTQKHHEYVASIKKSADTLLSIINEILDFSKLEAGKTELIPVNYNFLDLMDVISSTMAFMAREKGLDFRMNMGEGLPKYLLGDETRVKQILWNLIGNAIKFTKKGKIDFSIQVHDAMLRFDIADTGIGIREADRMALFNPFTQVDRKSTYNTVGSGLGLSISRSLIELMGGRIEVTSVYGEGSTFTVFIPLVPGKGETRTAIVSEEEIVTKSSAHILVVDDNKMNLFVATGMFESMGIRIETAESGEEAIRLIAQNDYDIVFMDHMMPIMNGIEATQVIRTMGKKGENLVIIALTANAVQGAKEMFLTAGMNDFASKPVSKGVLNSLLIKWLPRDKYVLMHKRNKTRIIRPDTERNTEKNRLAKNVPEIGIDAGLARIGGNWDAFRKGLEIFSRAIPNHCRKLQTLLNDNDIKSYAIEIHGLKGALANLGCAVLSESAAQLEEAAKKNDSAFCRMGTGALIADLESMNERLAMTLADSAAPPAPRNPPGDKTELAEALAKIHSAIDQFDADAAIVHLNALAAFDFGNAGNANLVALKHRLEEFDFDGGEAILTEMRAR